MRSALCVLLAAAAHSFVLSPPAATASRVTTPVQMQFGNLFGGGGGGATKSTGGLSARKSQHQTLSGLAHPADRHCNDCGGR